MSVDQYILVGLVDIVVIAVTLSVIYISTNVVKERKKIQQEREERQERNRKREQRLAEMYNENKSGIGVQDSGKTEQEDTVTASDYNNYRKVLIVEYNEGNNTGSQVFIDTSELVAVALQKGTLAVRNETLLGEETYMTSGYNTVMERLITIEGIKTELNVLGNTLVEIYGEGGQVEIGVDQEDDIRNYILKLLEEKVVVGSKVSLGVYDYITLNTSYGYSNPSYDETNVLKGLGVN